jgi:hypothetical protein
VSCYNWNDGSIDIFVSGGTTPYSYAWSNSSVTKDQTDLYAGVYYVEVSDSNGCIVKDSATIAQPSQLQISNTFKNVSCFNDSNGSVDILVIGGTLPYNYRWTNGKTTEDISKLGPGSYSVTVTDSHYCEIGDTVVISEPTQLIISHTLNNVSCNNGNDGRINLTVSGGTTPYSYKWSSNQNTRDISNLIAGGYSVIVTDSNGCIIRDTAVITEPPQLTISHKSTDVTCFNFNDGKIDITVNGGTNPYSYNWSNNSVIADQSNLSAGNYLVIVKDSKGCLIKDQ